MSFISEYAIVLTAAVIALIVFHRLGMGTVLGYLAAGLIIGPDVLGLVTDVEKLRHIADMGVVFLLFIIGLELQPSRLWALRKPVFGLGGAQVLLTTLAIAGIALALGQPLSAALLAGFGLAMSSTALALQTLSERKQLTSQHGRTAFAILLFQDVSVIPVLAILPFLGAAATDGHLSLAWDIVRAILVVAGVVIGGHFLLRPFFRLVAGVDSHELFTAAALLVVVGTALLMDMADLSMALGSFLAGVLLADSEYRHELEATMEPFKGLLLGLFFTAVGMSVDLDMLLNEPATVGGFAIGLIALKGAILYGLGRYHGLRGPALRNLALAISQGGEFAFVLYASAEGGRILDPVTSDMLVTVVTVSMAITPLLMAASDFIQKRQPKAPEKETYDTIEEQESQVIIAGFGRVGQVVSRILRLRKIPFTALDKSFEQVDFVRKFGVKVYFGDASRLELLYAARAEHAKALVIAVDDVDASVRIAQLVKRHFPHVKLIARARNRDHVYKLRDIGAEVVVREAFYSSLELTRQLLSALGTPKAKVNAQIQQFQEHDEALLLRQQQFHHDEARLIASVKQYIVDLEDLFEQDQKMPDQEPTRPGTGKPSAGPDKSPSKAP